MRSLGRNTVRLAMVISCGRNCAALIIVLLAISKKRNLSAAEAEIAATSVKRGQRSSGDNRRTGDNRTSGNNRKSAEVDAAATSGRFQPMNLTPDEPRPAKRRACDSTGCTQVEPNRIYTNWKVLVHSLVRPAGTKF